MRNHLNRSYQDLKANDKIMDALLMDFIDNNVSITNKDDDFDTKLDKVQDFLFDEGIDFGNFNYLPEEKYNKYTEARKEVTPEVAINHLK